jgi:hypothetical protein
VGFGIADEAVVELVKRPCKNKYGVYWQNYGIMRQGAHGAFVLDELSEH